MKYRHRFQIKAPLEEVVRFHRRAASLAVLTPAALGLRIVQGPETLSEGDEVAFSFWLGPLALRWRARIEEVSDNGFADRQIEGPFRYWVHRHTFSPVDPATTNVTDEVDAELRLRPVVAAAGLSMWVFLPLMFAYRSRETRRLLEAR